MPRLIGVASVLFLGVIAAGAAAQTIVTVPQVPGDPTIPHQAYEGAPVTLKAILRGALTGTTYSVRWDTDRDGDFSDEHAKIYSPDSTQTIRDIGRTFTVPAVDRNTLMIFNVEAHNNTSGTDIYGAYPLFVWNFQPSSDPRLWTQDQIEVMRNVALDEALWYIHRNLTNLSGVNVATIQGRFAYNQGTPNALMLFASNGHYPAYPPATLNAYSLTISPEWHAINNARWATDPYAEDAVRMLNYLLSTTSTTAIPSADESNVSGGITLTPIAGTDDSLGAYNSITLVDAGTPGSSGAVLAAFAAVLPALQGTPVQLAAASGLVGQSFEFLVQQAVDYVAAAQIDGDVGIGAWYVSAFNGNGSAGVAYMDPGSWAQLGLSMAEAYGSSSGVIVSDQHKYRCAQNYYRNLYRGPTASLIGSAKRFNADTGASPEFTGGALLAAGWLGITNFSSSDPDWNAWNGSSPSYWSTYCPFSKRQLKLDTLDNQMTFLDYYWTASSLLDDASWAAGLWTDGDYLGGNTSAVYGAGRTGVAYALFWTAMGLRAILPEPTYIGTPPNTHDWKHDFYIYCMRAQERGVDLADPWLNYSSFGAIADEDPGTTSYTYTSGRPYWSTALAGMVLTPALLDPDPVAVAAADPLTVTEGCAGSPQGRVTFTHDTSFHPSPSRQIVLYQWDVDSSDGLSWESGTADYETTDRNAPIVHTYNVEGSYTATLRVIDDGVSAKAATDTVAITVLPSTNLPPTADAGGPYTIYWSDPLTLAGSSQDPNEACGDTVICAWDLDNDGQFDDAFEAAPTVPWAFLPPGLPLDTPLPISMRAMDAPGLTAIANSTLTIISVAPSNPGATDIEPDGITWTWQDNAPNEDGFKVWADPGAGPPATLQGTTLEDAESWLYAGLTPNAPYSFQVAATNSVGDTEPTVNYTRYTLAGPPVAGQNVVSMTTPGTSWPAEKVFFFINPVEFGSGVHGGGIYAVSAFRYFWDTSETHTFTGAESVWNTGDLDMTPVVEGAYYLHLQSLNEEGMAGETLDIGPFALDLTGPEAVLDCAAPSYVNGGVAVTVTLSEPSPDFAATSILATNATVTAFTADSPPLGYSFTLTPQVGGSFSCVVPAGVFTDDATNANLLSSNVIERGYDTLGPIGTLSISAGMQATHLTDVTLILAASDDGSGVADMRFRNETAAWTAWEPYAVFRPWTLPTGDGLKTVSVEYRDALGNVSAVAISDTITLDTVEPAFESVQVQPDRASVDNTVTITFTSSEPLSGLPEVTVNNHLATYAGAKEVSYTFLYVIQADDPMGMAVLQIAGADLAGNFATSEVSGVLEITQTVPIRQGLLLFLLPLVACLALRQPARRRH